MPKPNKYLAPEKRREPIGMAEAVYEKCLAERMCMAIDASLKRLRAERRAWNRRGGSLSSVEKFAAKTENP